MRAITVWVAVGATAAFTVAVGFAIRGGRSGDQPGGRDDPPGNPAAPRLTPAVDPSVPPATAQPAPAGAPTVPPPSPAIVDLVARLNQVKPGPEADYAVAVLARHGEAAAEIGRQLDGKVLDHGGQHQAVRVLQAIDSDQSRTMLRRMALEGFGGCCADTAGWAAQALATSDPGQVRTLLASTTPQVLQAGLNALDGKSLDAEEVKLLKVCLANESGPVRWRAAAVLAKGSTGPLAGEAVEAVGNALAVAADLPTANTVYPNSGGITHLEMSALPYINSLKSARVDERQLSDLARRLRGRARDSVVLAQGLRGDRSVRPDVVKLARDPQAGLFRAWAATALGQVGTPEDLPLLRELAATDPLAREGRLPPPHPPGSVGTGYPVREAAKGAIVRLQKK